MARTLEDIRWEIYYADQALREAAARKRQAAQRERTLAARLEVLYAEEEAAMEVKSGEDSQAAPRP